VGLFLCTAALHGWWSVVAALAVGQSPPTPSWLGVHFFAIRCDKALFSKCLDGQSVVQGAGIEMSCFGSQIPLPCHLCSVLPAASLDLCTFCRLACVAAQTVSLVVASGALLVVAVQGSRAAHGDSLWEPLLDGRADEEHGASQELGKRWQLVYGVLKYVWPDSLQLQLRWGAAGWHACALARLFAGSVMPR
jgi:hypothetical protein